MTTAIALPALNGTGQAITLRADQNVDASVALRTSMEFGGAAVGPSNPIPVTSSTPTLSYTLSGNGTVQTTSGVLITTGQFARTLTITTLPTSTTNVWLNPAGGAAVVGSGVFVAAGGGSFSFGTVAAPMPSAAITAITDGASPQSVAILGG